MARVKKYEVPFGTDGGKMMRVDILVEGWTGGVTTLTAGRDAFTTEETNEHDWFVPVRYQTGYLTIVCEEDEWRGLLATSDTSHEVVLVETGVTDTTRWRGYVCQEAFTHNLYGGLDEYQIPVQCPLSILESKRLDWTEDSRPTFGNLLWRLLNLCDVPLVVVNLPDNLTNETDDVCAYAGLEQFFEQTSRYTWVELTRVTEQYMTTDVSAKEILEAVCEYWGWTLRLSGVNVYLCGVDDCNGYRTAPFSDLRTMDSDYEFEHVQVGTPPLIEDATYMSDEHDVEIQPGVKFLSVKNGVEGKAEDVFKVDVSQVGCFAQLPNSVISDQGHVTAECASMRSSYVSIMAGGFNVSYDGNMGRNTSTRDILLQHGWEYTYGGPFRRLDMWESSDDASKTRYNFTDYIFMSPCYETAAEAHTYGVMTMRSIGEVVMENCALCISANIKAHNQVRASTDYIEAMVTIGDQYWNGNVWQTKGSEWRAVFFQIPIGSNQSTTTYTKDAVIVNNKNYQSPYQGAEGYAIPIESGMEGVMVVAFRWQQYELPGGQWPVASPQTLLVSNLKFEIVPVQTISGIAENPKEENNYRRTLNAGSGEKGKDLKWKSWDNNPWGTNILSYYQSGYVREIPWVNGGTERPEDHLLRRMARLYGGSVEWREVEISDTEGAYRSMVRPVADQYGRKWEVVAVKRKWREGIARLVMGLMRST